MITADSARFDGSALYAALDAKRRQQGISWRKLASQLGGNSPSTIMRTKDGGNMETDGVLAMVRWLGCSIECFSQTNRHLAKAEMTTGTCGVLRFDTRALYAALDDRRRSRGLTWLESATEIGVSPSQLTHLSKGGRIEVHVMLAIVEWLGRSAESFTHITDW